MPVALSKKKEVKEELSDKTASKCKPRIPELDYVRLEHNGGSETRQGDSNTSANGDARGTIGCGACGSGAGSSSRDRGRVCSASTGGCIGGGRSEWSGNTESRLVRVRDASSEGSKGLCSSGRWVDSSIHATFAVRLPGAEEPDGVGGLGYFEGENTDLTSGGIERHEWRSEAILLGNGVELLSARGGKRALGNRVVASVELEVY